MLFHSIKNRQRFSTESSAGYGGRNMNKDKFNPVQRNYKDTLFRLIFSDKEALLSLYNAMSGNDYDDPEELEIVTLENAIYMNKKNDLAFVIDSSLNLYEHQSTDSPNLPMRNLFYISRELEKLTRQQSLYSPKQVMVPTPRFIVFYNGKDTSWERKVEKLSDAYEQKMDNPELELKVTMLNINLGKNNELMKKCKTLFEYMQYVEKVRKYTAVMSISQAVEKAVNESIKEGILADFLLKNKAEAVQMSIFEYDEEKEMKLIRRDMMEIGLEQGLAQGLEQGLEQGLREGMEKGFKASIKGFILVSLEELKPEERIVSDLQKYFAILPEEGRQLIAEYREAE